MKSTERHEQFEDFYEATKTPVFRAVLLASAGDWPAAEDAVAEAYERAFARWRKLSRHPNPTAWVIRTALNHRISTWRHLRRETAHSPALTEPVADPMDPALALLIRELPRGQREVLALRVLLDFSTKQTADALRVKQGTVKTQLHRALQELRTRLVTTEPEEVHR